MSFAALDALSAQLAHALRARGVTLGDRVVVQSPKAPELLALAIACARLGAMYTPLNTAYTDVEVAALVADAEPSLVVRATGLARWPWVDLAELLVDARGRGVTFDDAATDESTPAALVFTSGTTGRPKGAVLTQGNLVFGCRTLNQIWEIDESDVLVHVLPLFHVHGLFVAAYCALSSGATMRWLDGFALDEVLPALDGATLMMGVPTRYARLLADERFTRESVASLRVLISGSAPMRRTTHEEFFERCGQVILERYGMTETGMITSQPLRGERRMGSVGRALPGVEVRVEAPSGAVGEVLVRGPNVFAGYWRRPELRESAFTSDGFFRTGDRGVLDAEGRLDLVGRSKDLIITGGLNVYPKEVENALDELDGVVESAVVGVADEDLGESVAAAVVAVDGFDPDRARSQLREVLAPFKIPRRLVVVAELPRNAMGKVQRDRVRALIDPSD